MACGCHGQQRRDYVTSQQAEQRRQEAAIEQQRVQMAREAEILLAGASLQRRINEETAKAASGEHPG